MRSVYLVRHHESTAGRERLLSILWAWSNDYKFPEGGDCLLGHDTSHLTKQLSSYSMLSESHISTTNVHMANTDPYEFDVQVTVHRDKFL